ncbi:DUF935 domain-containing protein [Desulfovibrio sp. OttesenSCG-928-G15]|nr:DUF935 domain-containing protein [Desulfovibrio sp. OttesenSCG-928-G15]
MQKTLIDKITAAMAAFRGGPAKGEMQTRAGSLAGEEISQTLRTLTPRKLAQALNDADNGDIEQQHRLFADAEDQDEHIFTELSKRRRALLTPDWTIHPAVTYDGAAKKKAEAMADNVRGLFDSIPNFEDVIFDMADGIGHGFAALEIEWGYDGKYHVPLALHHRPQHWFCLSPVIDGQRQLRLRSQENFEGLPLWDMGWLIHTHKSKSGWFARYGLFRTIMAVTILKQYARTGFAEFNEIHGLPFRVGKYPLGASEQEKTALLNGLRALGRDAAAIIPDVMQIDFVEAIRASETPYATMWDKCDKGISKAILGGTLTTQADGHTSTNALGRVHDDVRQDLRASDARQIASSLSAQILLPLAVLNFGLSDPKLAPWLEFDTSEPEDLQKLAETLPKLATVMQIPAAWAHEKTRIPMPEKGEAVLAAPEKSTVGTDQPDAPDAPEKPAPENKKNPENATRRIYPVAGEPTPGEVIAAAVPSAHGAAGVTDPQAVLDTAMDLYTPALQPQMEAMLAPLFAAVKDGLPPDELMARLAALYPELDTDSLQEQMARVYFVTELYSRLTAGAE